MARFPSKVHPFKVAKKNFFGDLLVSHKFTHSVKRICPLKYLLSCIISSLVRLNYNDIFIVLICLGAATGKKLNLT
jgi:hypothetical protein